jgi:hypothetical protein
MGGKVTMDIYAACSYKERVPVGDPKDDDYETPSEVDGYFTDLELAKAKAHAMFLAWTESHGARLAHSSLRADATVWAPGRPGMGHEDCLVLWVMYEAAAGRMDDPDRTFYPQMRESSFKVRTIKVDDSRADGLCHEVALAGDCSLDADHSGTHDWER